jgi:4-hydroxy 2-oxovalerate aldolase
MRTDNGFADFTLLDTTLRDGGHVIGGRFPREQSLRIQASLDNAGVDILEIGQLVPYSEDKTGTFVHSVRELEVESSLMRSRLAFMVRPDWTPVENISRADGPLNTVRVAFHKKDIADLRRYVLELRRKDYKVYLNPINTPQYDFEQLRIILSIANEEAVENISIVDTYGSLSVGHFNNLVRIFDESLRPDVTLGLHSHDNKGMSMLFALSLLDDDSHSGPGRPISIDATLGGMGRAPGNLKTEAIVLETARGIISKEKLGTLICESARIQEQYNSKTNWGPDIHYLMTAMWDIDRTYGEKLIEETGLSYYQKLLVVSQIAELPGEKTFDGALLTEIVERVRDV